MGTSSTLIIITRRILSSVTTKVSYIVKLNIWLGYRLYGNKRSRSVRNTGEFLYNNVKWLPMGTCDMWSKLVMFLFWVNEFTQSYHQYEKKYKVKWTKVHFKSYNLQPIFLDGKFEIKWTFRRRWFIRVLYDSPRTTFKVRTLITTPTLVSDTPMRKPTKPKTV